MDFSLTDDQQAIADLAKQICESEATHERLKAVERGGGPRIDRTHWDALAQAGLVGITVPEAHGGQGLGFVELALIVEQVGRTAAAVPYLETVVLGGLPVAAFGSDAQQQALLPGVAGGELVVTAALDDALGDADRPPMRATADGDGWRLDGAKICVPAGQVADRVLVAAATGDGPLLAVVDPDAPGVTREALDTTNGQPDATLVCSGATVGAGEVLAVPGRGADAIAWIAERGTAALCAYALGVCEEALRLTAEYTKDRKQFGAPIASFQAVAHRAADAYIDTEAIRLTAWQAAWRLAEGRPAAEHIAIAKIWAADGGYRVAHAAQHLHGGIGVDRDYPLHRYFLAAKQLELTLGGATHHLRHLGRLIAASA